MHAGLCPLDWDGWILPWNGKTFVSPSLGGRYQKLELESISVLMAKKAPLFTRLQKHFGTDPAQLPVLEQNYEFYDRANLHLAIDELSQSVEDPPTLIGIVFIEDYHSVSLSRLSRRATSEEYDEGPVEYIDEPMPDKQRLSCVKRGLYLSAARTSATAAWDRLHSLPRREHDRSLDW